MSTDQPVLEFTGERFTPECVREIWYEHMHRYAFASRFADGVLACDAACGEGYGTAMLRAAGATAVGVDIDAGTVQHARQRYGHEYVCASVTCMPFLDASFELLTSFETIEHLAEQQTMLAEFRRVLREAGLLIISSPDKSEYSDASGYQNPDHVCELYQPEFVALLEEQFEHVCLYGQRLLFTSMIWRNGHAGGGSGACHAHYLSEDNQLRTGISRPPMYWIALCSNDAGRIKAITDSYDLFADEQQSVYAHYDDQIRKNMRAGHDLQARAEQIEDLQQRLAAAEPTQTESRGWLAALSARWLRR